MSQKLHLHFTTLVPDYMPEIQQFLQRTVFNWFYLWGRDEDL